MAKKSKDKVIQSPIQPWTDGSAEYSADEISAMRLIFMGTMAEMGITAEDYSAFMADDKLRKATHDYLESHRLSHEGYDFSHDGYDDWVDEDGDDWDDDDWDDDEFEKVDPIPGADKKSLRLKIQMKDVNKPPMWREIVTPADFTFEELHQAIQAVTGMDDCHMWAFQRRAYDGGMQIGLPATDDDPFGDDGCTHDASETPVTGFLAHKGAKLEYVYDFGDDWTFTVSVLEVMDRKSDTAVCTKWKCDFQPIEDCGGVWVYLQLRDAFSGTKKLTAKQKRELAESFGYDSFEYLSDAVDEAKMDLDYVNERLADIRR